MIQRIYAHTTSFLHTIFLYMLHVMFSIYRQNIIIAEIWIITQQKHQSSTSKFTIMCTYAISTYSHIQSQRKRSRFGEPNFLTSMYVGYIYCINKYTHICIELYMYKLDLHKIKVYTNTFFPYASVPIIDPNLCTYRYTLSIIILILFHVYVK